MPKMRIQNEEGRLVIKIDMSNGQDPTTGEN